MMLRREVASDRQTRQTLDLKYIDPWRCALSASNYEPSLIENDPDPVVSPSQHDFDHIRQRGAVIGVVWPRNIEPNSRIARIKELYESDPEYKEEIDSWFMFSQRIEAA